MTSRFLTEIDDNLVERAEIRNGRSILMTRGRASRSRPGRGEGATTEILVRGMNGQEECSTMIGHFLRSGSWFSWPEASWQWPENPLTRPSGTLSPSGGEGEDGRAISQSSATEPSGRPRPDGERAGVRGPNPQPPSDKILHTPPDTRPRVFRIHVVEEGTGRGVPLVELKTVNQIRYVTDSNGIVAFDEPGLFDRKVFFSITSHGYEVEKDGFGYRGKALEVTAGGSAGIVIHRLNVARRLYRVTGAGIYRDSVLTGDAVPIREPLLNAKVFGQDSAVNAVYQGKIHWFWGDTNRPDYPLGNFHVPGATSDLPGQGALEPEVGASTCSYFLDENGFCPPDGPHARRGTDLDLRIGRPQRSPGATSGCSRSTPKSARCLKSTNAVSPNSIRNHNDSKRLPSFPKPPHTSANSRMAIRSCFRITALNTSTLPRLIPWFVCRPTPSISRTLRLARLIPAYGRALGCRSSNLNTVPTDFCALRLEDQHAAPAAGSANQADRLAADQTRGGPP